MIRLYLEFRDFFKKSPRKSKHLLAPGIPSVNTAMELFPTGDASNPSAMAPARSSVSCLWRWSGEETECRMLEFKSGVVILDVKFLEKHWFSKCFFRKSKPSRSSTFPSPQTGQTVLFLPFCAQNLSIQYLPACDVKSWPPWLVPITSPQLKSFHYYLSPF